MADNVDLDRGLLGGGGSGDKLTEPIRKLLPSAVHWCELAVTSTV